MEIVSHRGTFGLWGEDGLLEADLLTGNQIQAGLTSPGSQCTQLAQGNHVSSFLPKVSGGTVGLMATSSYSPLGQALWKNAIPLKRSRPPGQLKRQ